MTFLNILFLSGIAAAAVPILIHLFSRRQARRMDWASIRFLQELNRQRIRRIKLRQLLLLLLRALAIILFAVAMGRPVLTGMNLTRTQAPSTVCLLIDTSYSMGAARDGEPTFEQARARAREVIDLLSRDDEVYLIPVSNQADTTTPYPMQDLGQVRQEIDALEVTHRRGNLVAGLELASRLLRASQNINKEIYLVTDLQAVGWRAMLDSTVADLHLPEDVAVCVIGPGSAGAPDNVAIEDVRAQRQLGAGGHLRLEAVLTNHSDEELRGVPVEVELGGVKVGETFVDLPAGATVRTEVALPGGPWESAWGRVWIPEDALAVDDERFFVMGVSERMRIGVLTESDAASSRAASFVRLALEPEAGRGPFAVRKLSASAISRPQIADLNAIIVAGLTRLDQGGLELLKGFVRDGGGLMIFPGERSDLRFYNDRLLAPFLPVKIARVVEAGEGESFRLVPSVPGHPIFAGFRAGMSESVTRARFRRVVKVVPGGARVLARFRGDLPALVEGDRVLLFASSVDRTWNDFPTSGAFVPLLHQAMLYLTGSGLGPGQMFAGAPVERLIPAPPTPTRWRALGPDGEEVALDVVQRGDDLLLRFVDSERVGIYRVLDEGDAEVVVVAVNPDTGESDLEPASIHDIQELFAGRPFSHITGTGSVETSIRETRYGRELWRLVLLAALVVLVFEVFMSRGKGAFTPAST